MESFNNFWLASFEDLGVNIWVKLLKKIFDNIYQCFFSMLREYTSEITMRALQIEFRQTSFIIS